MRFKGIETFDILHDHTKDIPDIVNRVQREKTSGNVLILISGKAQTGKSNTGLWLAYQLTEEPIITFKIENFFKVACDTTLSNKVIVYDEAQQDIRNWWDITYRVLKQILESYGYLHHTLIVITPRTKNLYGLFDLFHFLIKMRKSWIGKEFSYYANFYLLDNDLKGKPIFVGFQDKFIPKVPENIWDEYMTVKMSNYENRVKEWMDEYEKSKLKKEQKQHEELKPKLQQGERDYCIDENGVKQYLY